MQTERKQIKGEDFIKKVLAGERDFYGIELEYNFDLSGHELFGKMQDYLKQQYLAKYPIMINNSDLSGVKAPRLYFPYAQIESSVVWNANLEHSTLSFANFRNTDFIYTDFRHAELDHADLQNTNLQYANLKQANLYYADLRNANLEVAQLLGTNLVLADLRNARNLEKTYNLRCATFGETRVTRREETIITSFSDYGNMLEVEG
jgi:uncharacterized protein YjbI with pentapeptide repeats